jgi:hypothetical protein
MSKKLAFYTCFFGNDVNFGNVVSQGPECNYDCYYFTNNKRTFGLLNQTRWKGIFVDTPIYDDDILDSFSAKQLKANPYISEVLNEYEYLCYIDTKLNVEPLWIEYLIDLLENTGKLMAMAKHPCDFHSVWDEYNLAITVPKYKRQADQYKSFIEKMLKSGYHESIPTHYATGFILRKNNEIVRELGARWYELIKECGINCQISFDFIQQIYGHLIHQIGWLEGYDFNFR